MGTRFDGHDESSRGVKLQTKGHNVAGSAEVGMPLAVSERWEVEPQAQVIIDRTYLDNQNDGISHSTLRMWALACSHIRSSLPVNQPSGRRINTPNGGRFSDSDNGCPCLGSSTVNASPPLPKLEPA